MKRRKMNMERDTEKDDSRRLFYSAVWLTPMSNLEE
jgi:hypothetical protein